MNDLTSLIERLEAATEGSRELDGAICLALGWTLQKKKGDSKPYYRKPGETAYYQRSTPPEYTTSIDAALTLMPEGTGWLVGSCRTRPGEPLGCARITSLDGDTIIAEADAATPALALLAAILKARQTAAQPAKQTEAR